MLFRRLLTAPMFAVLALGLAIQAKAAVPVEDMSTRDLQPEAPNSQVPVPIGSKASNDPNATGPGQNQRVSSPGQNVQLFYELQTLQAELLQLRGLVDDQAYEISRLRNLQRSQYLDIDRRLTERGHSPSQLPKIAAEQTNPSPVLQQRAPQPQTSTQSSLQGAPQIVAPGPIRDTSGDVQASVPIAQTAAVLTAPVNKPVTNSANPAARSNSASSVEVIAPTEKVAFERAFELMKDQQFEQSITAYQDVIESFPDGSYAPESRYWLGELYLMSEQLKAARDAFVAVVDKFPAHQKVPLSLYKLGVVNHRLGSTRQALEYLDDVVTRYPDTPAAGLARTYAAELR